MGVSGCGKSSVARAVSQRTGAYFIEGDAWHPDANIRKMSAAIPLDDDDRQGWLQRLGEETAHRVAAGTPVILACSALKHRYRELLRRAVSRLGFVYLDIAPAAATARVTHRPGHFMPATLIESQFHDLEPPSGEPRVLTLTATDPLNSLADQITAWWQLPDFDYPVCHK